jgi:hypothetical protein
MESWPPLGTRLSAPGLPDIISSQKSKFRYILEGLAMEDIDIFYGHLVFLLPFGILLWHLVYFVPIWYIFPALVCCNKKNLATWSAQAFYIRWDAEPPPPLLGLILHLTDWDRSAWGLPESLFTHLFYYLFLCHLRVFHVVLQCPSSLLNVPSERQIKKKDEMWAVKGLVTHKVNPLASRAKSYFV